MQPAPGEGVEVPPQITGDSDDQQEVESDGAEADRQRGIGNTERDDEVGRADSSHRVERHGQHMQADERHPADGKEAVKTRQIAIAHRSLEHRAAQRLAGHKSRGENEEGGQRRRSRGQPEQLVKRHAAAGSSLGPAPAPSAGTTA